MLEQQLKIELQYIGAHAGELLWGQVNGLLFPGPVSDAGTSPGERGRLTKGFRLFWRIIRPMTYYWLGDLGWHLFKIWFRQLFKKRERRTSD